MDRIPSAGAFVMGRNMFGPLRGAPARVERARMVLLSADALPGKEIGRLVECSEPTVVLRRNRYAEKGLPPVTAAHRGRSRTVRTSATRRPCR
ncbi:MAG: helix-turn-helix domain-containing protein [Propionibacteriales bacterium]|nr:helix-turn-helix domain-containing protein [Propionibacteriales bacterium]